MLLCETIKKIDFVGGFQMQKASARDTISFRLPAETKQRIELLANATRRSKTFVIEEALNQYLDLNEWQVKSILEGLKEIEAGQTTSHEAVLAKWEARACE
jgi:RHH-type transcriptional regulator, rel operon repressor / antitoxin RelB